MFIHQDEVSPPPRCHGIHKLVFASPQTHTKIAYPARPGIPDSSPPHQQNRTRLATGRDVAPTKARAISSSVDDPEPLSLIPGPAPRCQTNPTRRERIAQHAARESACRTTGCHLGAWQARQVPASTPSRWAPTTTIEVSSPVSVSAITFCDSIVSKRPAINTRTSRGSQVGACAEAGHGHSA